MTVWQNQILHTAVSVIRNIPTCGCILSRLKSVPRNYHSWTTVDHKPHFRKVLSSYGLQARSIRLDDQYGTGLLGYHLQTDLSRIQSSARFYCASGAPALSPEQLYVRSQLATLEGSPLTTKRIVRRKKTKDLPPRDQEVFDVLAYATADRFNLSSLKKELIRQGLYQYVDLPEDMLDEAIYVEAIYGIEDETRIIFFYKDGSVVFWNMPEVERNSVMKFLRRHQEGSYDAAMVREEFEHIEYSYTGGQSKLQGDEICLMQPKDDSGIWEHRLERYAFSNALALSVKLAIWEAMLDQYVDSIEYVLQDLKDGKKIRLSEMDVLRKTGWLLHLRHMINLRSDLLDPPDPYWDREHLETLFNRTISHLEIARRTKVMNEKLTHCCELTNMLQDVLKDKHHTRLEWMIIILIMIEVVFEVFHTYEKHHNVQDSS